MGFAGNVSGATPGVYAHYGSNREQVVKLGGEFGFMFGDQDSYDSHGNNYFTAATTDFDSDAFPTLPPNEIRKSLPNKSPATITMGADQLPCATDTEEVFE